MHQRNMGAVLFRILSLNFRFYIFLRPSIVYGCPEVISWWSGFTYCRVNKSYHEHCNVYHKHSKAHVLTNVEREFFFNILLLLLLLLQTKLEYILFFNHVWHQTAPFLEYESINLNWKKILLFFNMRNQQIKSTFLRNHGLLLRMSLISTTSIGLVCLSVSSFHNTFFFFTQVHQTWCKRCFLSAALKHVSRFSSNIKICCSQGHVRIHLTQ